MLSVILPPALPNYHYCVVWETNLVTSIFRLCPWHCLCLHSWMSRCGILSFVLLCSVMSHIMNANEKYTHHGSVLENRKSLAGCSLSHPLYHIFFPERRSEASRISDGSLNTILTTLWSSLWSTSVCSTRNSHPNVQMASAIWSMMLSPDHHMSPLNRKAT